jgi:PAS domain S-box-containing protein
MTSPTILVVEDNPITRKMLRFALEIEGYYVVDAANGRTALEASAARRPDLLILDYMLPDTDGFLLLAEVRLRTATPKLPAIVITGMVSRLEELRAGSGASVHLLAKPVEPSQLLEVVRAQLSATEGRATGGRVLVVDDELMNRKLASFRLRQAGYEVDTAAGGPEGLELARRRPPDAILADVLMPSMDGFAFCREVRRDPTLAGIPIVLVSSAYVDEADRELAQQMGADALVVRTPDLLDATTALEDRLRDARHPPAPVSDDRVTDALHRERLQVQLERQAGRTESLLRQAAIQATALSIIRGLSEVLAQPKDMTQILGDVLVHCLDAAGLSTGLLYVVEPSGHLRLQVHFGLPVASKADAEAGFGDPEFLRGIAEARQPVALSKTGEASAKAIDFLARLGHSSALVLPFVVLGETFGELVLASDSHDLSESAWMGFARSLALQFGQTVALGQSLKRAAASEGRYRALMEQANDAILILEPGHRVLEANLRAEQLLGRPRSEIVGRHYHEFVAPDEQADSARLQEQLLTTGTLRVEQRQMMRPDGTRVSVEVSASVVHLGEESAVFTILRDITERERLEAQLLQSQKMESMGRLAGGIAHDFNNLLGIITGYGGLLRKRISADPQLAKYVEDIVKAADRAAGLTRQLLAFSRKQVLQPQILDLNVVVGETEKMLRRLIGEDIQLVTVCDEHVGAVRADPGQMDQVLVNLAVNARDAMPQGGRLTIETGNVVLDRAYAGQHAGVEPGPYVMLAVSDTGHGMAPDVQVRVFEPFFTTKEPGKGTGLGLATVHGIVKQSGGHIWVYSEPGQGTTFKIYLPRADAPPTGVERSVEDERLPHGSETILLVEDETSLRNLIRECLEATGYTVLEARHGAEALEISERHRSPIRLLLTDVVMPLMSGRKLAEELRASRPEIRVLYMSGYTDDAVVLHGVLAAEVAFLQKPFTTEMLARRDREVLDAPTGEAG